jgi:hypothetical protein
MRFSERDGITSVTSEADFALWPWFPRWVHVLFTPLALAITWPMLWVATRYAEWVTRRRLEDRA